MGSLRLRVRQHALLRKYPIVGILELCAFIALVLGTIHLLEQYSTGRVVNRVLLTLHMGDLAPKVLLADGLSPQLIFILLIIASVMNIFIDDFIVKRRSWILRGVEWLVRLLAQQFRVLGRFVRRGWVRLCEYLGYHSQFDSSTEPANGLRSQKALAYPLQKAKDFFQEMNGIRKNPSKGGLVAIFAFSATPKFIPGVPGTVALAVLVIRCNHFGWKGWATLIAGVLIRIICVVLYWNSIA